MSLRLTVIAQQLTGGFVVASCAADDWRLALLPLLVAPPGCPAATAPASGTDA
jgi:hypothetical protein